MVKELCFCDSVIVEWKVVGKLRCEERRGRRLDMLLILFIYFGCEER